MTKLVIKKIHTGYYETTRSDGQVINFESRECEDTGAKYWATTYENDFDGDNTYHASTKKKCIEVEQRYADNI